MLPSSFASIRESRLLAILVVAVCAGRCHHIGDVDDLVLVLGLCRLIRRRPGIAQSVDKFRPIGILQRNGESVGALASREASAGSPLRRAPTHCSRPPPTCHKCSLRGWLPSTGSFAGGTSAGFSLCAAKITFEAGNRIPRMSWRRSAFTCIAGAARRPRWRWRLCQDERGYSVPEKNASYDSAHSHRSPVIYFKM